MPLGALPCIAAGHESSDTMDESIHDTLFAQVADGLRAELRHVTEERDELLPLQNAQTDALVAEALAAAESPA